MPGDTVKADYATLKDAGSKFRQQADSIRKTLQDLQRMEGDLKKDWIGGGQKQFSQEMSQSVFPEFGRLGSALEQAGKILDEIAKIFQDAEQEASQIVSIKGPFGG